MLCDNLHWSIPNPNYITRGGSCGIECGWNIFWTRSECVPLIEQFYRFTTLMMTPLKQPCTDQFGECNKILRQTPNSCHQEDHWSWKMATSKSGTEDWGQKVALIGQLTTVLWQPWNDHLVEFGKTLRHTQTRWHQEDHLSLKMAKSDQGASTVWTVSKIDEHWLWLLCDNLTVIIL